MSFRYGVCFGGVLVILASSLFCSVDFEISKVLFRNHVVLLSRSRYQESAFFLVSSSWNPKTMARTFILWLHGLGDSGPANEGIKTCFKSPELSNARWLFPSAPPNPVTCNNGRVMPSWFDVPELPFKVGSPIDESSVLEAVKNVHAIIDKEIARGTNPENVFICGLSQGGALTLASVLLYPRTLGGGAVLSGWVPFSSSVISQFPEEAKKTPILWSHGTDDELVLFEAGQAALTFLEQAGVTCEFKAYPGLGHSISNKELHYIESWIKLRRRARRLPLEFLKAIFCNSR